MAKDPLLLAGKTREIEQEVAHLKKASSSVVCVRGSASDAEKADAMVEIFAAAHREKKASRLGFGAIRN